MFDRLMDRDLNAVWLVWAANAVLAVLAVSMGAAPVRLAWGVAGSAALLCLAGVLIPRRRDRREAVA